MRAAAAIVFCMCICAAAFAGEMAITIKATDGAALISGDGAAVRQIEEHMKSAADRPLRLDDISELIKKEYGDTVKIELYQDLKLDGGGVFESLRLPLRRAVLLAVVPPIEGLSPAEAAEALAAFDIRTADRGQYDRMSNDEKIKEAFAAKNMLVVLAGVSPASIVEIVSIRK